VCGMDNTERLDLAVQAQLAAVVADRVRDRTASVEQQYAPVARAIEDYVKLYGRDADPFDEFDIFLGLVIQHGGVDLGREDLLTGMEMYVQRAAASDAASDAMHELQEAMGDHQGTVLEWVGCTREAFGSALESKLRT
jgi:hypothetical protein